MSEAWADVPGEDDYSEESDADSVWRESDDWMAWFLQDNDDEEDAA